MKWGAIKNGAGPNQASCPPRLPQVKVVIVFWSERRCAVGTLHQGYAVTSKFIDIFSFFLSFFLSELITQHVVVVVNLPRQAAS